MAETVVEVFALETTSPSYVRSVNVLPELYSKVRSCQWVLLVPVYNCTPVLSVFNSIFNMVDDSKDILFQRYEVPVFDALHYKKCAVHFVKPKKQCWLVF